MPDTFQQTVSGVPAAPPPPPDAQPAAGGGSKLSGFLHGLLSAASGLPSQTQTIDPNTGSTVTAPAQHSTGDMFKGMFAGMLSGLAGGVRANQSGEHGALGAFGGGFNATEEMHQQQAAQAQQKAQQQFKNQQSAQEASQRKVAADDQHKLNQLAMVQGNQDIAFKGLQAARLKIEMSDDAVDRMNKYQELVSSVPGAEPAGFHKDGADLMNDPNVQNLMKEHAGGRLLSVPLTGTDANGNQVVTGIQSYLVPKSALDQPTTEPVTWYSHKAGKDGVDQPVAHVIPAGQMSTRDAIALSQKDVSGLITPKDKYLQDQTNARQQAQIADADRRQAAELQNKLEVAERTKTDKQLAPNEIDNWAKQLRENRVSLNSLRYLEKFSNFGDVLDKLGPNWSESAYQSGLKLKEYYTSGKGAQTLLGGSNAIQHLATADAILQKLDPHMTDIKAINQAIAYWGRQFGNSDITSLDTLAHAIAPELSKTLAGGKADKDSVEAFMDKFKAGNGITNARAAIHEAASIVHQNIGSVAGAIQSGVPNATSDPYGVNISSGAEASLHHFGFDNPLNFGNIPAPRNGSTIAPKYVADQAVKDSKGDLNKAWGLMKSRGWTGVENGSQQ